MSAARKARPIRRMALLRPAQSLRLRSSPAARLPASTPLPFPPIRLTSKLP